MKLSAMNSQGATVYFKGKTQKECLEKFDREYRRKGFQIHIENDDGIIVRIVKDTFR
jgi:hypothetical protein